MFNLVDTFFISLLGTQALAAVSFTFPVTFGINCITMGIGIGLIDMYWAIAWPRLRTKCSTLYLSWLITGSASCRLRFYARYYFLRTYVYPVRGKARVVAADIGIHVGVVSRDPIVGHSHGRQ